jgi:hypothetical protein
MSFNNRAFCWFVDGIQILRAQILMLKALETKSVIYVAGPSLALIGDEKYRFNVVKLT